jgi:AAA domain
MRRFFEIQQRLPAACVGTVDMFQGQEAATAVYSTATPSHADAPRGMEFLYSLNRLNVATSRARCLVLVSSSHLYEAECRTPRQISACECVLPLPGDGGALATMFDMMLTF